MFKRRPIVLADAVTSSDSGHENDLPDPRYMGASPRVESGRASAEPLKGGHAAGSTRRDCPASTERSGGPLDLEPREAIERLWTAADWMPVAIEKERERITAEGTERTPSNEDQPGKRPGEGQSPPQFLTAEEIKEARTLRLGRRAPSDEGGAGRGDPPVNDDVEMQAQTEKPGQGHTISTMQTELNEGMIPTLSIWPVNRKPKKIGKRARSPTRHSTREMIR